MGSDDLALYEYEDTLTCDLHASYSQKSENVYELDLPGSAEGADEVFAVMEYEANTAKLIKDGETIADNFYTGQEWEIGLKRYFDIYGESDRFSAEVVLEPLREDEKVYLQTWPAMKNGSVSKFVNIHLIVQYCIKIS